MVDFSISSSTGYRFTGIYHYCSDEADEEAKKWSEMKQVNLQVAGFAENRVITDTEAARGFERMLRDMPALRSRFAVPRGVFLGLQELKLPDQRLGDKAVRAFVQACVKNDIRLGRVELWRNQLGDAAAQALAQLVEASPKPGVYGLHLSHNYMSQVGVGMILVAAVKTGFYPVQLPDSVGPVPLWLRVHHQLCSWPVLSQKPVHDHRDMEQYSYDKSRELLQHLSQTLVRKFPSLFEGKKLPKGFELFCMPAPEFARGVGRRAMLGVDDEAPDVEQFMPRECGIRKCRSCTNIRHDGIGAAVHVPYFWSQGRKGNLLGKLAPRQPAPQEPRPPEAAQLCKADKNWRDWRPGRRRVFRWVAEADKKADAPDLAQQPAADGLDGSEAPVTPPEITNGLKAPTTPPAKGSTADAGEPPEAPAPASAPAPAPAPAPSPALPVDGLGQPKPIRKQPSAPAVAQVVLPLCAAGNPPATAAPARGAAAGGADAHQGVVKPARKRKVGAQEATAHGKPAAAPAPAAPAAARRAEDGESFKRLRLEGTDAVVDLD